MHLTWVHAMHGPLNSHPGATLHPFRCSPACRFTCPAPAVILDPATPRTPKHQIAEQVMTTGSTAQVLKRHMDSVIKVGGGQKCGSSGRWVLGGFWVLRQVISWWA